MMLTNLADLDSALGWMRDVGFVRDDRDEKWPFKIPYGGFDIVSNGPASQWWVLAKSPSRTPPHGFYMDVVVAPWVVEVIMGIGKLSDREQA